MKRAIPTAVVAAMLLGGCTSIPGLANLVKPDSRGGVSLPYTTGQGQTTTIEVQRFQNVQFADKQGNLLEPIKAETMSQSDVQLLAGDFEELYYDKGVLRFAQYDHEPDSQPYVVERKIGEAEFETLDKPFYTDNIFKNKQVIDAKTKLPLYFLTYVQNGKGWQGSFAPSLTTAAAHVGQIVDNYFNQFDGASGTATPKGTTQTAYYLSAANGTMTLSLATQTADSSGELNETPLKLKSVSVNAGSGAVSATVSADEKSCTFPQPSGTGPFEQVDLKITADGTAGSWESLIPIRPKSGS
ncbi:MAG TPA: hypothetical protein V6D47_07490 [Oscillatoriaceae cyanobacterium]